MRLSAYSLSNNAPSESDLGLAIRLLLSSTWKSSSLSGTTTGGPRIRGFLGIAWEAIAGSEAEAAEAEVVVVVIDIVVIVGGGGV